MPASRPRPYPMCSTTGRTSPTRRAGRVQASIDALGYRQSILAASLRTGRTKTIGVVIPDITNPFFGQVVRGCEDVLYNAGYSIFLCNTNEDAAKERTYLDILANRRVDGLLLFSASLQLRGVDRSGARRDTDSGGRLAAESDNTTVIDIDNSAGAAMAVRHLLDLGHKRIAHLGGPSRNARRPTVATKATSRRWKPPVSTMIRRWSSAANRPCAAAITPRLQLLGDEQPAALLLLQRPDGYRRHGGVPAAGAGDPRRRSDRRLSTTLPWPRSSRPSSRRCGCSNMRWDAWRASCS